MLSNKEIIERFDIPKSTLYGWKTERPKVYEYLANSDEQFTKYREVNILLDRYIQTVPNIEIFEYKELEYILELKLENPKIEELDNFHLKFIEKSIKIEKEPKTNALNIYKKLENLNLIEKYILNERVKTVNEKIKTKKDEKENLIKHYLKEFLKL
ncbi:MAG: hypothetical protein RBT59_09515 [Arcobacteraceae bacterium]|jgi:hypothetical protein|nr:hypothetical protein [Arcobacteraceae bacterium]